MPASRRAPTAALFGAVLALALAGCADTPRPPPTPAVATPAVAQRAPALDWSLVPPLPVLDPQQQRGHDVAVQRCSGCHTVGLDEGGAEEGPAFYKLARRYSPIALERRFAEVSAHGFDRMPAIPFTASEADDLVAYVNTLQGN